MSVHEHAASKPDVNSGASIEQLVQDVRAARTAGEDSQIEGGWTGLEAAAQDIVEYLSGKPQSKALVVSHEDNLSFADKALQTALGGVSASGLIENGRVVITSFQELNKPTRSGDQLKLAYEYLPPAQFRYLTIDRHPEWPDSTYARLRSHFDPAFALTLEHTVPAAESVGKFRAGDAAIKGLLGIEPAKTTRLYTEQEAKLLDGIKQGDRANIEEYLSYRSRTAYSAVSKIPEMSGMTLDDYFWIGCEALLTEAQQAENYLITGERPAWLSAYITRAVGREIKARRMIQPTIEGREVQVKGWHHPEPVQITGDSSVIADLADAQQVKDEAEESPHPSRIHSELIIDAALESLSPRERRILEAVWGVGDFKRTHTLPEAAQIDGEFHQRPARVRERIRQISNVSVKKLESPVLDMVKELRAES